MQALQSTRLIRRGLWLLAATSVALLAGCGDSSGSSAASPTTPVVTVPATSATATPAPTGPLSLVGLGDSIPGALHCNAPCRSYVEVLAELATKTLGTTVTASNLATNDSLTSIGLRSRVTTDQSYMKAIGTADIITIQIGFNDWQGPCSWAGHEECTTAGSAQVHDNLGPILDEVAKLRQGKPTTIRVVTYYDNTVGDPGAQSAWGFETSDETTFHTWYASALSAFNAMMCGVAQSHGATCVNLLEAFNGPAGDRDAGTLVGDDHLHPTQAGQELIATTIDTTGYAPIG